MMKLMTHWDRYKRQFLPDTFKDPEIGYAFMWAIRDAILEERSECAKIASETLHDEIAEKISDAKPVVPT